MRTGYVIRKMISGVFFQRAKALHDDDAQLRMLAIQTNLSCVRNNLLCLALRPDLMPRVYRIEFSDKPSNCMVLFVFSAANKRVHRRFFCQSLNEVSLVIEFE